MRSFVPALIAAALLSSPALAQRLGPRDVDTLSSRAPDVRSAYGPDSLQFGELRLPAGTGPFPVAVVIHGGCWTRGFATRVNTAAVATALANNGIASWNIEYRQVGDPGGGWPNTFRDVGAGVDHLRTLATQHPLDLNRVIVTGHSAGAHLALWAGARPQMAANNPLRGERPLPARAAVALDGPADIASWIGADARVCGRPVIAPLMGGTPAEVPDRYRAGSPGSMLPLGVRQYLLASAVMTTDDAIAYQTAARAAGDSVSIFTGLAGGHFGVIAPGTPFWPPVREVFLQALADADRADIAAVRAQFEAAENASDIAQVRASLASDIVLMAPNAPAAVGIDSAAARLQRTFDAGRLEIHYTSEEIEVFGDWGFDRGTYRYTMTPKSGAEPSSQTGKYLWISQRQADGSWKLSRVTWNGS